MSVDTVWVIVGGIASIFAIVAGLIAVFRTARIWILNRPFKTPMQITSFDAEAWFERLHSMNGKTIRIDTHLDFSVAVINDSYRIYEDLGLDSLFENGGLKDAVSIPVVHQKLSSSHRCDSLDVLRIVVVDKDTLRLSHGGTGVAIVPLKGTFKVEARYFSGPSTEITLREVS